MADGRIVVELDLDAKGVVQGVRTADGAFVKLRQSTSGAASGLGKLKGLIGGVVAAQAARALASYAQRMFDLGTAAEETASKFSTVFGGAASRLDADLQAVAHSMGLTQTEARGLAATVGAVVQGMGYGQQASADYSAQILKLAGDLVSFSNVEGGTEQVVRALTSAITGERESLKTLGIVISETDVKQRALADRVAGTTGEITRQEKAAATLALITDRAGVAVGDLDRTQDSAANTARRLTAEVKEQEQTFARLLLPTFALVLRDLGAMVRANEATGRSFAEVLAKGILYAVGAGTQMVRSVGNVIGALGGLGVAIGRLSGGAQSPFGAFERATVRFLDNLDTIAEGAAIVENALLRSQRAFTKFQQDRAIRRYNALAAAGLGDTDDARRFRQQAFEASSELGRLDTQVGTVTDRLQTLRAGIYQRGREGVFGGADFQDFATQLEKLKDPIASGADLGATLDGILSDAVGATTDAAGKAAKAREAAQTQAEQDRRKAIDQAFELRDLEVQAMREGLERTLAEIDLGFDRQREAYRRGYGDLSAEVTRLFAQNQGRQQVLARAQAAGGGAVDARGPQALSNYLDQTRTATERQRDLNEAIAETSARMGEMGATGTEVAQSVLGSLSGLANNYHGVFSAVLGSLADLFQTVGEQGGTAFDIYKGIAIAEAIVSTYVAANRALAEGGPITGPLLAAAMVTQGLANVARIRAARPGGGSTGGGVGASPTAPQRGNSSTLAGVVVGRPALAATRPPSSNVTVGVEGGGASVEFQRIELDGATLYTKVTREGARQARLLGDRR